MYKKLTAMAAALLLITAGCGNVDDSSETDETETTSQAEEVTEELTTEEAAPTEETTVVTTTEITETTTESATTAPAKEKENSLVNNTNVLSSMKIGMTEEEALNVFGIDNCTRYDDNNAVDTYEYEYAMSCDNVFGTGLSGYMFAEFDSSTHKLICCGYHLGRILTEDSNEFICSEEQLSEAYNKIKEQLTAEYGESSRPEELSGVGLREELTWDDDTDHIWAIYGIDLWSENSGVNEIVVSRSIDR